MKNILIINNNAVCLVTKLADSGTSNCSKKNNVECCFYSLILHLGSLNFKYASYRNTRHFVQRS